jgi:iron complex transport system permease protein
MSGILRKFEEKYGRPLAAFVIAAFLFSLRTGSLKLSLSETLSAIFDSEPCLNRKIIWLIRLPRNITAALVGASLALAGAILQGIMRNPLASPNIIGVSAGGGLAAVVIMILLPQYFYLLVPAAFIGSLAATLLIFLLAWNRGLHPMRLILSGVAVSSLLGAFISALMLFYPDRLTGVIDFMVGGLNARTWKHVNTLWPYTIGGIAAALLMAKRLNILALGDDAAVGLGLKVEQTRIIFIVISALLAAAAVSVAGLLGFVGLIAPHMMRMIVGSDHRYLFPASILFGAGLLMTCDTLGRIVLDPVQLPVGIIMAMLGAPFFLYLLRTKMRHGIKS